MEVAWNTQMGGGGREGTPRKVCARPRGINTVDGGECFRGIALVNRKGWQVADIQYKCPSCSAPIEFDAGTGRMQCAYCGSSFEVAAVERFNDVKAAPVPPTTSGQEPQGPEKSEHAAATPAPGSVEAGQAWRESKTVWIDEADLAGMTTMVCNSCGAEIVADPTTISTRCGFCNNTFVASTRLNATRVPDFIIPFKIDRKAMMASFLEATKGKFLLPKTFRDEHELAEATGAYVPYWYHDGTTSGTIQFTAENHRSWSDSEYDYVETDVYNVVRSAEVAFKGIPVCGTTKLEPKRAEGAEPFHLEGSEEFGTAYLSGYAASAPDIEAAATVERADERARATLTTLVRQSIVGYDSVRQSQSSLQVERTGVWYALLPVWLIVIAYDGQEYPFAINGQTGEVVGSFPISKGKLFALRLAFSIPLVLLFLALGWMLMSVFV